MKYDESFVNSFNDDSNNGFCFQTFRELGRLFRVRANDTSERICDANDFERESERREQQQHPGEQSKRSALCVPPQMLLLLKVRLPFSPR